MIEEFEKYLRKERKSDNTIKTYSKCIEQFFIWYFRSENKETFKLDRETINGYRDYLILVEKRNAQTINVRLCALNLFNRFFCKKNAPKNYILKNK